MARHVTIRRPLSLEPPALPVALVVTALALTACGGREAEIPDLTEADADEILFERGTAALEEGSWSTAREYFVQIRDNYPQSPLRAQARLGVVESYEGEGTEIAYLSALNELQEFLRLYPPTHELAPEASSRWAWCTSTRCGGPNGTSPRPVPPSSSSRPSSSATADFASPESPGGGARAAAGSSAIA